MDYWPHAPLHKLDDQGTYFVTVGTYQKQHYLNSSDRLNYFQSRLFKLAAEYGWFLQAWSILANHYHLIAISPENPGSFRVFISRLHSESAELLNALDSTPGRQVWFQFRETKLSFPASYFARLKYVHHNPVHHKLTKDAAEYPWCSMNWFKHRADVPFQKTIDNFKIDKLNIYDDFGYFPPVRH